jgi:hypothetical protein
MGMKVVDIASVLGVAHSTVVYYTNPSHREKHRLRTKKRAQDILGKLKHEWGGKCQFCGYDDYLPALHFHHIDPSKKSFGLSAGSGKSYAALRAEAEKCVLACACCHHKIHGGILTCPSETSMRSKPRQPTRKSAPRRGDSGQVAVRERRGGKARG